MGTVSMLGQSGDLLAVTEEDIDHLHDSLEGAVLLPGDPHYDAARAVWNGMVDKRPAAIAYCSRASDVINVVDFARERGLRIAVRAGGHNASGNSVCDDGLVVDLSRMKGVAVDAEGRRVRVGAGLRLGEFDAATQAHGLATTMGVNTDTGVAGLTLGGGIGRLGRRYGLACDNLLRADVVTADAQLITASEEENADLFWGLRGGGGNFGIVTALEFRLHSLGPVVLGGGLVYTGERVREAMRAYAEFSSEAPDGLAADAALVTGPDGRPAFSVALCYAGDIEAGWKVVEPMRRRVPPDGDTLGPVEYTVLQRRTDAMFERGRRYYWKAHLLDGVCGEAVDRLLDGFARAPSSLSIIVMQQVGGAIARVPVGATAYAHRQAACDCFAMSIWEEPSADDANVKWARDVWQSLTPFSTGAVYVNNLGDEGESRVQAAYGSNYPRLRALKTRYDPTNFFSGNQNVKPEPAQP